MRGSRGAAPYSQRSINSQAQPSLPQCIAFGSDGCVASSTLTDTLRFGARVRAWAWMTCRWACCVCNRCWPHRPRNGQVCPFHQSSALAGTMRCSAWGPALPSACHAAPRPFRCCTKRRFGCRNSIDCLSKCLPRFMGAPSEEFPWPFTVVDWVEGVSADQAVLATSGDGAAPLVACLHALWAIPTTGAPAAGLSNRRRGVPLVQLDMQVQRDLALLADEVDLRAALSIWAEACNAPGHRTHCWVHGDLKPDNMLVRNGQLVALIDWGCAAVGDPAVDLAVAWRWAPAEQTLMAAFPGEAALWARAEGWALFGACAALACYRHQPGRPSKHPELVSHSRQVLHRLGLLRKVSV